MTAEDDVNYLEGGDVHTNTLTIK